MVSCFLVTSAVRGFTVMRTKWMPYCFWVLLCCAGCQDTEPAAPNSASQVGSNPTNDQVVIARPPTQEVPDLGTRSKGVDWSRFLGPSGDGKSPEKGILTAWPKEGPPRVWQARVGTSYAIPAVSRGRLFMFDRHASRQAAADKARLTCYEAETGKELWRFEYPTAYEDMYGYNNGPRCGPVVDDDRVYIRGAEGVLHCVGVLDGQPRWKIDLVERFGIVQNFFGEGSSPVVEDDLLIVQVGGSPKGSSPQNMMGLEGNGTGVVAFDKFTGEVRYAITNELCSYASPVLATIDERRWCFVFSRGGLIGFNPSNGDVDLFFPWRANILESVNASNPVVVGNRVLISETYGPGSALLEVRPGKFDVVWTDDNRGRNKSLQTHWNTSIYHEGYVYGSSGRHTNNAELRCVKFDTGEVMWSEPGLGRASLLYVDGHFVCLCEYGDLLLLKVNPEKFDVVASVVPRDEKSGPEVPGLGPSRLLEYPAWAAPILSHGLLYLRGKTRLVCMELIAE